jgi:uncharacterized iron-regulated protein
MKKFNLILVVCLIINTATGQTLEAYRIYNNKGEPVSYGEMAKTLSESSIVLFGELHDNPIAHWLQIELTNTLYNNFNKQLVLGAEMFESDNQLIVNEYLSGTINQKRFEEEARLWPNYKTDYKPLIEFAKEKGLPFIATNIPRRYATVVSSSGFEALESLTSEAKSYIAPLPIDYDPTLPSYKAMLSMGGMPGKSMTASENFPKAQAVKDATMAWFINKNLKENNIFIHFHGTYHSNNYEGIYWYLTRTNSKTKIATIATVIQDKTDVLESENNNLANFIIVVPSRMTRTY